MSGKQKDLKMDSYNLIILLFRWIGMKKHNPIEKVMELKYLILIIFNDLKEEINYRIL